MRTFGTIMSENRGVGPGFDFLRVLLAVCVVLWHSHQISYGPMPIWLIIYTIVPAFFALSGFLVAGSMVRVKSVQVFLALRAIRILPALAVEIVLSALILGPLVTAYPLAQYVADARFLRYFENIAGFIHYQLPGVFLDNPLHGIVNGQLWTIPGELRCYVALAVLMVLRLAARPRLMLAAFLLLATAECLTALLPGHHYTKAVMNTLEMLVLSFLAGNVMFLWRDRIPFHPALFVAALATYLLVGYFVPALSFLVGTVAICYAAAFIGMCRVPRLPLLGRGDYSYGIYLYSFPIQQAVAWAFPGLREWYWNVAITAPFIVAFAMLSWHGIEKPALKLRKYLSPAKAPVIQAADAGSV